MMASAVREERRPGLAVFAAHLQYGHVARMWLEASAGPRAGLIGRHGAVDLALPLDDALSLRHLMFVVRRKEQRVQFVVLDLETHSGLQLETGQGVWLAEASGPLIVCASEFVFFCIPTGGALPWDSESRDAWSTLLPRETIRTESRDAVGKESVVGRAELASRFGGRTTAVTAGSLRRGVLVGRADRCDVESPIMTVSRVHAVLLRLDEAVLVIDAGSSNGTWRIDHEVKIDTLRDGDIVMIGPEVTLRWIDGP